MGYRRCDDGDVGKSHRQQIKIQSKILRCLSTRVMATTNAHSTPQPYQSIDTILNSPHNETHPNHTLDCTRRVDGVLACLSEYRLPREFGAFEQRSVRISARSWELDNYVQ